jgi:hypothetical protein
MSKIQIKCNKCNNEYYEDSRNPHPRCSNCAEEMIGDNYVKTRHLPDMMRGERVKHKDEIDQERYEKEKMRKKSLDKAMDKHELWVEKPKNKWTF